MAYSLTTSSVADLIDRISKRLVAYKDPPNVGCCSDGPVTTSLAHIVLEFWERQPDCRWIQNSEYEIELAPGWPNAYGSTV